MPHILIHNLIDTYGPHIKKAIHGKDARAIHRLVNRSMHLGRTGDIVIVSPHIPQDFVAYLQKITGEILMIMPADFQSETAPMTTKQLLDPIKHLHGQNFLLDPYIQSLVLAAFSEELHIPLAYTSSKTLKNGLTVRANDKAYFRKIAPTLDIPIIEDQTIIKVSDTKRLKEILNDLLEKYDGAFIQANLSAGGDGNIDIYQSGNQYHSKLGTELGSITEKLLAWTTLMEEEGSDSIILAPYLTLFETYTASGFIPAKGEPYLYGIFKQLVNESGDYQGFEFPARGKHLAQCTKEMQKSIENWLRYLQTEGYVGPSNLDFIIGHNKKLGKVLVASESNTRWDGFRFALQHAARIKNWDLRTLAGISSSEIGIHAVDHVTTSLATTTAMIKQLRENNIPLLGYTTKTEGIVVMLPPTPQENIYETAVAAIAPTVEEAEKIFTAAQESIT